MMVLLLLVYNEEHDDDDEIIMGEVCGFERSMGAAWVGPSPGSE